MDWNQHFKKYEIEQKAVKCFLCCERNLFQGLSGMYVVYVLGHDAKYITKNFENHLSKATQLIIVNWV